MTKKQTQIEESPIVTTYRAVCTKGDYTGIKRTEKKDAFNDAYKHQKEKGNHIINLEVELTHKMSFEIENEENIFFNKNQYLKFEINN
jgi:hypothetical protein